MYLRCAGYRSSPLRCHRLAQNTTQYPQGTRGDHKDSNCRDRCNRSSSSTSSDKGGCCSRGNSSACSSSRLLVKLRCQHPVRSAQPAASATAAPTAAAIAAPTNAAPTNAAAMLRQLMLHQLCCNGNFNRYPPEAAEHLEEAEIENLERKGQKASP